MASMNIREVDVTSLEAFKGKAKAEGLTLRAWVLAVLQVALLDDGSVEATAPRALPDRQPAQVEARAICPRCDSRLLHDPPSCWYCKPCKRQFHDNEVRHE